ncbi:hypothetical protein, partial [Halovulum sp. GXIMD14793]
SQNPQVYQVEINSCHKRQCRASGFVHEPSLNDAASRANGVSVGTRGTKALPNHVDFRSM